MASPAIRVEPASLQISDRGVVTGVIYFALDECGFPDAAWNDFVVVVLSWWCAALLKSRSGTLIHEQLRFMDGPFAVQLEPSRDARIVELRFLRQGRLVSSGAVAGDDLRKQLVGAGRQVLEFCERAGATGDDVEHLREGVAALNESEGRGEA